MAGIDNREIMISLNRVSMVYNRASEQLNSFKEYAIKLAKGQLSFKGFEALSNLDLEVRKGDVFGIVGINGSGKSTLLKVIAGVLEPTRGSCIVNGSIAPLIELGAGFDQELTARENIYLNGALLGYSKKFIDENFDDIVAFAEIIDFLDMPLKNYSSGMVARIAFAIATVIVPDILLVDEVLAVGDFLFQRKCEDRIGQLIEKHGVTVLIVSHNNEQISRLCNRALWIEKGSARMLGDAQEVCHFYSILGGRTGSAKAESQILSAIDADFEIPESLYNEISGTDYCDTAVRASSIIWDSAPVETVAVACGTTHINTILANGMAGAYHAPILQTTADQIPVSVLHFLEKHKPKRILYFDCWSSARKPHEDLKQLDWNPEVVSFTGYGDFYSVSSSVFSHGSEKGIWGSTVAVIDFDNNPESLVAAPFLYRNKVPVFSSGRKAPFNSREFLSILESGRIDRVVVFGDSAPEEIPFLCGNLGIETILFSEETTHKTCFAISNWILEMSLNSDSWGRELCMASQLISNWQDLLAGGAYCGHRNCTLLLQDPSSLDSMADCLDFATVNNDKIDRLTFFGGRSNLDELDRKLLCKAVMEK